METDRLASSADTAKPLVLFAYCDRDMCMFVKDVLALDGYEAVTAVLGREALSILRSAPDCMIVLLEPFSKTYRFRPKRQTCLVPASPRPVSPES